MILEAEGCRVTKLEVLHELRPSNLLQVLGLFSWCSATFPTSVLSAYQLLQQQQQTPPSLAPSTSTSPPYSLVSSKGTVVASPQTPLYRTTFEDMVVISSQRLFASMASHTSGSSHYVGLVLYRQAGEEIGERGVCSRNQRRALRTWHP